MKLNNIKWFTLLELIVVVTILWILSTIWFVAYSWYLVWVRDINRTSQLKLISDGLELYRTKHSLPLPDDYVEVKANGEGIAYQWYAWKNVLESIEYTSEWVDPKDKSYYSYYLTKDKKYYQLMWFLEEQSETEVAWLFTRANALDYSIRYPTVYGKKLWILTDENNTPIQEISEIKSAWDIDLAWTNSGTIYIAHLKDNINYKFLWSRLNDIEYSLSKPSIYWVPKDCPEWFVGVPWDSTFNQKWFCVAKYEMSYDETWASDVTWWTDRNTRKYYSTKIPVSKANRLPITELTMQEAINQCNLIWTHLITNNEWMTIARNIELIWKNWSKWSVWNWVVFNWISNVSYWCAWKQDWNKRAWPTWSDCAWTDRNKLELSNGWYIYDFAWNVLEFVNKANTLNWVWYDNWQTVISWVSDWTNRDDDWIYDFNDMDKYGSINHYWEDKWMWSVYYWDWVSNNIFTRWGYATNGYKWWIYSLGWLSSRSNYEIRTVGFRCAK